MIPGLGKRMKGMQIDEKQMQNVEAIIRSMTREERIQPDIIEGNRKNRIANGSGTNVLDVSQLLKQFKQMKKMFKQFAGDGGNFKPPEGMLPHDAMKMSRKLRSKRKKVKRKKR